MTARPGFAYCLARIQARYAALPGEPEWQRLAGARTLPAYLAEARNGPLLPWVRGFSGSSDAHDLERGTRALAWELTAEVARWVPAPWRAAVLWVGWVPALPLLEHLARGAPAPAWAVQDSRWRTLLGPGGTADPAALARAGLAGLIDPAHPESVALRWTDAWRERWPQPAAPARIGGRAGAATRDLESLAGRIATHLADFRRADPADAWGLRRALRERLRLRFHQRTQGPVAVFVYLALALLDLERLRRELLARALFPAQERRP